MALPQAFPLRVDASPLAGAAGPLGSASLPRPTDSRRASPRLLGTTALG